MPSVYIETTIPSFYFETRTSIQVRAWRAATIDWWDNRRHDYTLVTSTIVEQELEEAPAVKAAAALRLLAGIRVLAVTPDVRRAADFYVQHRLMPAEAQGDAAHLAIASVHSIDFLLTWNCRHLANANKVPHIRALNERLALPVPILTTPFNLLPEPPR